MENKVRLIFSCGNIFLVIPTITKHTVKKITYDQSLSRRKQRNPWKGSVIKKIPPGLTEEGILDFHPNFF